MNCVIHYRGAIQALKGGAFDRSRRKYVLDNIRCRGDETSLEECSHDGWNIADCKIDHEAGVVCMNDGKYANKFTALRLGVAQVDVLVF